MRAFELSLSTGYNLDHQETVKVQEMGEQLRYYTIHQSNVRIMTQMHIPMINILNNLQSSCFAMSDM